MTLAEACLSPPDASRAAHVARRLCCRLADVRVDVGPGGLLGVFDPVTGDVVGSGTTLSAALVDAVETVRAWHDEAVR